MGRRPRRRYNEDTAFLVRGYARDGLINKQIAHNLGIAVSTLSNWIKKYPALAEALKEGKEVVDRQVESALFKRAMGYTYEETEVIVDQREIDDQTIEKPIRIKKTTKQVAPDVTAQIFWLVNRKGDIWRHVNRQEITGKDGGPIEMKLYDFDQSKYPESPGSQ